MYFPSWSVTDSVGGMYLKNPSMMVCLLCRVWRLCTKSSHSAQNHSEGIHSPQRMTASFTWQWLQVIWTMFSADSRLSRFCGLACCQHCWTSFCLWLQLDNGSCWTKSWESVFSDSCRRSSSCCIFKSSKGRRKKNNTITPTLQQHTVEIQHSEQKINHHSLGVGHGLMAVKKKHVFLRLVLMLTAF